MIDGNYYRTFIEDQDTLSVRQFAAVLTKTVCVSKQEDLEDKQYASATAYGNRCYASSALIIGSIQH